MNEILQSIINVLITIVVIPLISYFCTLLINFLKTKVKSVKAQEMLSKATVVVTNSVKMVLQTYVNELKSLDKFDLEAQKTALTKAKDAATLQFTDDLKQYIENNYCSLDCWLTTQIEATINTIKNK